MMVMNMMVQDGGYSLSMHDRDDRIFNSNEQATGNTAYVIPQPPPSSSSRGMYRGRRVALSPDNEGIDRDGDVNSIKRKNKSAEVERKRRLDEEYADEMGAVREHPLADAWERTEKKQVNKQKEPANSSLNTSARSPVRSSMQGSTNTSPSHTVHSTSSPPQPQPSSTIPAGSYTKLVCHKVGAGEDADIFDVVKMQLQVCAVFLIERVICSGLTQMNDILGSI